MADNAKLLALMESLSNLPPNSITAALREKLAAEDLAAQPELLEAARAWAKSLNGVIRLADALKQH